MKLYMVQFDGGQRYVEAESFGEAVRKWREQMLAEFGGPGSGWEDDAEPEGVTLIDDDPVIR